MNLKHYPLIAALLTGALAISLHAADPAKQKIPTEDSDFQRMNRADFALSGTIVSSKDLPSMTENRATEYVIRPTKVYRGKAVAGTTITFVLQGWLDNNARLQARLHEAAINSEETIFLADSSYQPFIKQESKPDITGVFTGTEAMITLLTQATSVPIGWSLADGKPVSPWAMLGDKAWPADHPKPTDGTPVCVRTGRPEYRAGEGIDLLVEKAPDTGKQRASFIVTVKNTSKEPRTVQALRSDGKRILWPESVLIVNGGYLWFDVGCKGVATPTQPVVLKPGESVQTTVTLTLSYGGSVKFCLGELSRTVWYNESNNIEFAKVKPPIQ